MVKYFKGLLWIIGLLALIAVIGRVFLFEIATTDSYAMVPSIFPGDTFLVLTRGLLGPGESVVCKDPENPGAMVVSRIMGVPGSTIAMSQTRLHINGTHIDHSFPGSAVMYEDATGGEVQELSIMVGVEKLAGHVYSVAFADGGGDTKIEFTEVEDGFYLVGDNRYRARDSRHFGELPVADCIGTPFLVIWPGPDSGDFKFKHRILEWIH